MDSPRRLTKSLARLSPVLRSARTAYALVATVVLVLVLASLHACQPSPRFTPPSPVFLDSVTAEPPIRVRIKKNIQTLQVIGPARVSIGPLLQDSSQSHHRDYSTPLTVSMHEAGFLIHPNQGQPVTWDLPSMSIVPVGQDPIEIPGHTYPGILTVHRRNQKHNTTFEPIDVVNHTSLESYLPGVVHKEIYPDWHPTAFMVQAIAARTYAIHQIAQRPNRHFDLEASQVSQAYGGARTTARALDAVRLSRGVVLTYNKRLVPTYYSSCCGGAGQDAAVTFPYGLRIPPLKGTKHDHCRDVSPTFHWGPITRDGHTLSKRIAAWSAASRHPAASLTRIKDIRITAHNSAGRPARFTITDTAGGTYHLNPEEFRFACNYPDKSLPPLVRATRLKSSFVRVHVKDKTVSFAGNGFGHGVGLCQWGTQVMAQRNYDVAAIFSTYYPKASLRRAY